MRSFFGVILATVSFLISSGVTRADENQSIERSYSALQEHRLLFEGMGHAGLYSFNYEYDILSDLSLGAGFSFLPATVNHGQTATLVIPVFTQAYLNRGHHRAFVTGGISFFVLPNGTSSDSQTLSNGTVVKTTSIINQSGPVVFGGVGYEYAPKGAVFFRATPYLLGLSGSIGVTLGLSVGTAI